MYLCTGALNEEGIGHSHHECGVGNVDAAPTCSDGGLQHKVEGLATLLST